MTTEIPIPTESFAAPNAPPDEAFRERFRASVPSEQARAAEKDLARDFLRAIRGKAGGGVGVEDFLQEFKLSSREGMAIMALAESLARAAGRQSLCQSQYDWRRRRRAAFRRTVVERSRTLKPAVPTISAASVTKPL